MQINKEMAELIKYWPVMWQLVSQQLTLKYRRTVFGYLWTLINPLITMSITAFVFSSLFQMELKSYVIYLFSGLIAWNCFSGIVTQTSGAFIANEALIKKIYLPKIIFPLGQSFGVLIDCFFNFLAMYLIVLFMNPVATSAILFIPIAYLILFIFSFGIALSMSIATVFFRDLQYILSILMQGWFFLTPVMYKVNGVSENAAILINSNPVTPFIELFRAPIYLHELPSEAIIFICSLYASVSMVLGVFVFNRYKNIIVYRL
jgi:ABC-2 type transport system permease protein/lipopolysaccharide transport system permease protein